MHLPLAATSLLLTFLTSSVAGRPSPHDAYPPETILTRRATPSPLDIMQASKIIQTFVHESPAAQAARLSSKDSLLRLVRAAMDSEARLRQQHPMAKGSANAAEAHKMNHYVLLRIQGGKCLPLRRTRSMRGVMSVWTVR